MRKSTAFTMAIIALMLIYGSLFYKAASVSDIPVGTIIAGIVTLTSAYIGLGVVNNGVKGNFYRPELDSQNRENKPDIGV
jgi:hypothetical protein